MKWLVMKEKCHFMEQTVSNYIYLQVVPIANHCYFLSLTIDFVIACFQEIVLNLYTMNVLQYLVPNLAYQNITSNRS